MVINLKIKRGFSLVELILSLAILAVLTSTILVVLSYMNKVTVIKGKKFDAVNYGQEAMEALLSIKDDDFSLLDPGSSPKTYYLSVNETSQTWELTEVASENLVPEEGGLKRIITLERFLAEGTPAVPRIIKAVITVKWSADEGMGDRVSLEVLLSSWSRSLNAVVQNSWCELDVSSLTVKDLAGSDKARKLAINSNTILTSMGQDLSVGSHALGKVVHSAPSTLGTPSYGDGYITYSVATLGNYSFLTTDSNEEEVVIYDISATPTKAGFFDATGCDCKTPVDIFARNVSGTKVVYLLMTDRLILFDASTINGSTSQTKLSEYVLPEKAKSLFIRSNYAFIGFYDNDANLHMKILNVSNLNNIEEVPNAELDLGNTEVTEVRQIYSTGDTSRTYLLTNKVVGLGQPELYVINSSDKANMSILDTYDAGDMDPSAFTVITQDNIVLGGTVADPVTQSPLKVIEGLEIDNLTQCYEYVNSSIESIYDLKVRNDTGGVDPRTYLYLTTGETAGELMVLSTGYDEFVEGANQIPIDRL